MGKYHVSNTDNPVDFPRLDNIKAGATMNAGYGGYSLGTKDAYQEFARGRNKSLAESRIQTLLYEAGAQYGGKNHFTGKTIIYTDSVDYEEFAEYLIKECARIADLAAENKCESIGGNILTYFGVNK